MAGGLDGGVTKPIRWICDECGKEYDDYTNSAEVVHKCKNGRRNVPMRKADDDER
jgi:hypothetical protein